MNTRLFSDAMSELNEKYIMEATAFQGNTKARRRIPKWQAALAACLAAAAIAVGIFPFFEPSGTSPFVLTTYALEADSSISAYVMQKGNNIPINLFETGNGMKGFVFSYDAADPEQPSSISIIGADSGFSGAERIQEISGLEKEQGKHYLYYVFPENTEAPYTFPMSLPMKKTIWFISIIS